MKNLKKIEKFKLLNKSIFSQFRKPYQSTIAFEKFIKKNGGFNKTQTILDIGCNIGAQIKYLSKKNSRIKFTGIDYNKESIYWANKINKNKKIEFINNNFMKNNNKFKNNYDGIICIQTLCELKDLEIAIKKICSINSDWIAINSLFYEGLLEVKINMRDFKKIYQNGKVKYFYKNSSVDGDFNIHSLPRLKTLFKYFGYRMFYEKHKPKIKILSNKKKRGSYTIKSRSGEQMLFSGPVHLPWYFIFARKI
ncbi:class I SAM-dependent methyltransferase [Candidatus Pelagibacter sp.]|nr:class I SAM-dependent methyltransferase [Candidatus Pelagibacter sp.]